MDHPFDLPDDFPFGQLGRDYASGQYTIDEIAAKYNIKRDTFLAIRKAAPKTWTKKGPNLWWDDLENSEEDLVEDATAEAKAARVQHRTQRKLDREEKKAAEKWWRLEDAIEKAANRFNESMMARPSPSLETPGALGALPPGAAVWNLQDLHVGASFSASGLTAEEYIDQIEEAFRNGLKRARRNADMNRLYLVVGGDLVHVDNWEGQTTSGTPQDLIMSPDEALEEAIELLVRLVELARQVAGEIRLVPVRGNHDRMLGLAAAHAVDRHFRSEDDVMMLDTRERVYDAYGDHLLLFTHQLPKKKLKRIGDIITAEARSLLGETRYTTVYLGHLHFQAKDLEDISGRLTQQAPAPKRADRWHEKQGHVGSRKALQMHLIEPDTVNDATFSLAA